MKLGEHARGPFIAAASAALVLLATVAGAQVQLEGDPAVLDAEAKRELSLRPSNLGQRDQHDPGTLRPPEADALGCGAPCTTGTLAANHPYYDVYLSCTDGSFTAGTGPSHSVTLAAGGPQNVIYGGSYGGPGTSDISFYVHDFGGITYRDPPGGSACVFDPPDTAAEPNSIGLEQEWIVTPAPGITLTLREEIIAFGSTEENSGIRLSLGASSDASSTAALNMGVRWQTDYQNAGDDGPLFATMTCDPLAVVQSLRAEHELTTAEILDFYRIQNNSSSPIFSNLNSTTALLGHPDTGRPDRLLFGYWPNLNGSAWNYVANEGNTAVDSDSSVLYYYGYTPANAIRLAPGQSFRRSFVLFTTGRTADCNEFIPSCSPTVTVPPANQQMCEGGSVVLDASGLGLADCAGSVDYEWRDAGGALVASTATTTVSPATTTDYTVTVICSADTSCRWEQGVRVTVELPPLLGTVVVDDPDACNVGLDVTWPVATFRDPTASGTYNVYRSTVSCADALLRAPVATGLTTPRYLDGRTILGVSYYYVVEAEDARTSTLCSPAGPNGGAVARSCSAPAGEIAFPSPPAGIGAVLFASHVGDDVTFTWAAARALLPGEHFHLIKTVLHPLRGWWNIAPEGSIARSHVDLDTAWKLQFFEVQVADDCETLSGVEYPPGI